METSFGAFQAFQATVGRCYRWTVAEGRRTWPGRVERRPRRCSPHEECTEVVCMPLSTGFRWVEKARCGVEVLSEWPLLLLGSGSCHPGRRDSS